MNGYNKVILAGNLVADPEGKVTPNGANYTSLRLAVNRKYVNQRGETVDDPLFVNVTVWGKNGDACLKYLSKGRPVLVDGRLQIKRYEGDDGTVRYFTDIVANSVVFLGSSSSSRAPEESLESLGSAGVNAGSDVGDAGNEGIIEEIPF